jgi:hypothetical protein
MQLKSHQNAVAVILLFVITCLSAANAQYGRTDSQKNDKPEPPWNLLTPQTMLAKGFYFECRFVDNTITSGGKTSRTGLVGVQIIFDADKGPKINKVVGVSLSVKEGDKILVSAPIETAKHPDTGKIHWMQFGLHDEALPKSQVVLSYLDGIHLHHYIIPVKDFYEGRPK